MDMKNFVNRWIGRGYEKGEAQSFWIGLLRALFEVESPEDWIVFEDQINGKFIDARIPSTHVLIEQKSIGRDLDAAFEQAKDYDNQLPFDKKSRWIVCSDFQSFRVYDMNNPKAPPEIILLKDLPTEHHRLKFLIDENAVRIKKELEISLRAGEIVSKIYDAFAKSYVDPTTPDARDSLNKLCVRLVFCLYAEDAGIFPKHAFHDYLNDYKTHQMRRALINLFETLNIPDEERDPYLEPLLKKFHYVDGSLFAEDKIEIPNFTDESRFLLLVEAENFNWAGISPTIFGALFESTLNPITRRTGGMHYTSIENIHKVIDPLLLDELRAECYQCGSNRKKLIALQKKIGGLKFFDPACGSGNFLTETYLSLRRLENEILKKILGDQITLGDIDNPIKVSIENFYGIEVNDFAVAVARTAMWIAESQMMIETSEIIHKHLELLPLRASAHIVKGNALTLDWSTVAPRGVDYVIGNPPFVGASMMNAQQKSEAVAIFGKGKLVNSIDYVGAWYYKAAEFMKDTTTRAAFVSTNSITQGEQVAPLWQKLFVDCNIHIDFAHRTFRWSNEIKNSAAVHCVVVGFSTAPSDRERIIYDGNAKIIATNINPYLVDGPNVFIWSRAEKICPDAPTMTLGNKAHDGGNLILSTEECAKLLKADPKLAVCIRRYLSGRDLVNGDDLRYCLWLKDIEPGIYRRSREIRRRLEAVREFRSNSTSKDTRAAAEHPYLFFRTPQTDENYLCLPEVSSDRRKYIPIGFMDRSIIAAGSVFMISSATLFHFGVMTSSIHMMWMRAVGGRFGMGYRYSTSVVYNNFVWCTPTAAQRLAIERTAQSILDTRALYPQSTLADLYDPNTMPEPLRRAHAANDRAVLDAYGFDRALTEAEIVARLMEIYQRLTAGARADKIPIKEDNR